MTGFAREAIEPGSRGTSEATEPRERASATEAAIGEPVFVTRAPRGPLCGAGHIVVATPYPPEPGGSQTVMRNLLGCFDPASYTVATVHRAGPHADADSGDARVVSVMRSYAALRRLDQRSLDAQIPLGALGILRLARRTDARAILAVYPSYPLFAAARHAARLARLPWVAYLHDTLAEGLARGRWARRGAALQARVFREASRLFVMSRGMQDLVRRKYRIDCEPLEHVHPEPPAPEPPADAGERQAFWGGAVYEINARAVARVARALGARNIPLCLTAPRAGLARAGITGAHLRFGFHERRRDYLDAMAQSGLLLLALDGPDESPVHEDELATIFPTKTPEYLATGRPLLVHCPEHYFLARFVREHGCGLVVAERSIDALGEAAARLLDDRALASELGAAALRAARTFSPDRIAMKLRRAFDAVVSA